MTIQQDYLCQLLANRSDILSSIDSTSCTSIQLNHAVDNSSLSLESNCVLKDVFEWRQKIIQAFQLPIDEKDEGLYEILTTNWNYKQNECNQYLLRISELEKEVVSTRGAMDSVESQYNAQIDALSLQNYQIQIENDQLQLEITECRKLFPNTNDSLKESIQAMIQSSQQSQADLMNRLKKSEAEKGLLSDNVISFSSKIFEMNQDLKRAEINNEEVYQESQMLHKALSLYNIHDKDDLVECIQSERMQYEYEKKELECKMTSLEKELASLTDKLNHQSKSTVSKAEFNLVTQSLEAQKTLYRDKLAIWKHKESMLNDMTEKLQKLRSKSIQEKKYQNGAHETIESQKKEMKYMQQSIDEYHKKWMDCNDLKTAVEVKMKSTIAQMHSKDVLIQSHNVKIKELESKLEFLKQEKAQIALADQKNNTLKIDIGRKDELLKYWKYKFEELNQQHTQIMSENKTLKEQKDFINRQLKTQTRQYSKLEEQVEELKVYKEKIEEIQDVLLTFLRSNFKKNNLECTSDNTLYQRMQSISSSYLGLDFNLLYQDKTLEDQLKQILQSRELKSDLARLLFRYNKN